MKPATAPGSRVRRLLVPRSLRSRVTALAVLAVLGVLVLAGAGLVLLQRALLVDGLDETLARQADLVAEELRAGRPPGPGVLLSDELAVWVVGDGAEVLAAVPPGVAPPRFPAPTADGTLGEAELGDDGVRVLAVDLGAVTVVVAGELEDVEESAGALVAALAVAVPAAAAGLAVVVRWAVGRALRPVEAIRAEVEAIGGTALDRRVPEPDAPEEIGRLARTMNAMLARLEVAAERQRQFVADASHELRSPLARMRTELEVDAAHPRSADPGATARSVLAEVTGMQRLVDDLLLLARADAGALARRAVPVDLDEVVAEVVAGMVGRLPSGGTALDTAGVRPVQVLGDPGQLERVVGNLLDNAVRHARHRVAVSLAEDPPGTAVLTVADDGPGIPVADRERVFERFTRLDAARSTADGGAGLGLAIARDIARRHGGSVEVDPVAAEGARLVLRLPADPGRLPGGSQG